MSGSCIIMEDEMYAQGQKELETNAQTSKTY